MPSWMTAPGHEPTGIGISEIQVTKLGNRLGIARRSFFGGGIAFTCDVAQELSRLLSGALRRPGRPVLANGEPPLAPLRCSVFQNIDDGFTELPTRAKTRERCIP